MKNTYPFLQAPVARQWPQLDVAALKARMAQQAADLDNQHANELSAYESRKPNPASADVDTLTQWDTEGDELRNRHSLEKTRLEALHKELTEDLDNLHLLFAAYGSKLKDLKDALENQASLHDAELTKLEDEQAELTHLEQGLEEQRNAILSLLAAQGVKVENLGDDFSGLNDALEAHFLKQAHKERGVDPSSAPEMPELPAKPQPVQPTLERVLVDDASFNWMKFAAALLIGGIGALIGALAAFAIGALKTTKTGGVEFNLTFIILVAAGIALAFLIGKKVIKPLADATANENTPKPSNGGGDVALVIGGLMVGASAGAALGGLHTTTDGVDITPVFWFMLFIGTALAILIGKKYFPLLAGAMTLTCITPEEEETPTEKMEATIRNAKLLFAGFILALCALDFFGWWRYANEANAAHVGDRGAFIVPPVPAGLVMMCISTFLIIAKFSAVYTQGQKHKKAVADDLARVAHENSEINRKHEAAMTQYTKDLAAYEKYHQDLKEAGKSAGFRLTHPAHGIGDLATTIEAYRVSRADFSKKKAADTTRQRLEDIKRDVESQTRLQREALAAAEKDVNRVYTLADTVPA